MDETNNYVVELHTNDPEKVLIFYNWEYDRKRESYSFDISVNSGGFAAMQKFWFDKTDLEKFLKKIKEMSIQLSGSVDLKQEWEQDYIKLELGQLGHVSVIGEFFWCAPLDQHLKFGFETDQTCLQPLFNDLSQVLDDLHTTR